MLNQVKYLIIYMENQYLITNDLLCTEEELHNRIVRVFFTGQVKEVRVCELGTTREFNCTSIHDFNMKWEETKPVALKAEELTTPMDVTDIANNKLVKEDLIVYKHYTSRKYEGKRIIIDICGDIVAYKEGDMYGIESVDVVSFLAWVNGEAEYIIDPTLKLVDFKKHAPSDADCHSLIYARSVLDIGKITIMTEDKKVAIETLNVTEDQEHTFETKDKRKLHVRFTIESMEEEMQQRLLVWTGNSGLMRKLIEIPVYILKGTVIQYSVTSDGDNIEG